MPAAQSHSKNAQPGRWRTRMTVGSLAINLLLLVLLLRPMSPRSSSTAGDGLPRGLRGTENATLDDRPSAPGLTSSARIAMSVWSQLESNDFHEFAANLRRAGCPDETVCDVIRPAVLRSFNGRRGQLAQGGSYWATGESRRALRAQAEATEAGLDDTQDRLLAELVCPIDLLDKEDNNFEMRMLIELASGFLNRGAQRALLRLIMDTERIVERWNQRTRGILVPEDITALHRQRAGLWQRLGQILSDSEREEVDLRVWQMTKSGGVTVDARLRQLRLTPAEFRELSHITSGAEVSALTELLDLHKFLGDSPPRLTEADVNAQLSGLLGDVRFAQYRKDHDSIFVAAEQLAEQHHLPSEAAGAVYQTFEEFRASLAPLRAAWPGDKEQARRALLEQREQMRARLDAILAAAPEPGRRKALNSWIDQVIHEIWQKP